MKYILLLATFVIVLPAITLAASASDSFIIRQLVGDDSQPPTTPVIISATPVATSQIDLVWTASTDDIAVVGYRVYRNGSPIATTTQTTFSDSGLVASTTYSYTVDAYDFSFNISTTSLAVATTTLSLPVTPVASSTESSSPTSVPSARAVTITTTPHTATFLIEARSPVIYTIRWGRTNSFELGSISGGTYRNNHETVIQQLEPGTTYQYEVELTNTRGVAQVVERGTFTTDTSLSSGIPSNVLDLEASVRGTHVTLNWKLPSDFAGTVRVVRSHLFYPTTPLDGVLVYNGLGTTVFDESALLLRSPQYYTVFVQAPNGLVSSGAVVRVDRDRLLEDNGGVSGSGEVTPPLLTPIGDNTLLDPGAVIFQVGNNTIAFDALHTLPVATAVEIFIPVTALPPHLKSIIVTVYNPSKHTNYTAYLLKLDPAGDYYTTTIITPSVVGEAIMMIEVYDYTAATIRRMATTITYTNDLSVSSSRPFSYYMLVVGTVVFMSAALIVLVGWLWRFWFFFKRQERD